MAKRFLVSLILTLALTCGARAADPLPQIAANGHEPYVAVIVWHDIVAGPNEVWFDTSADTFRRQLQAIARGGYHVIDLETLRRHLERGAPLPSKPLVLTFDDNAHGIYDVAFPLLRSFRFKATLFVHTNYVGKTTSLRHNTWAQLQEMERSGLVDVQSMTANHPQDLRALSDDDVVHELELSRRSLLAHLHHDTYALAYPYDNYDDRVAALLAKHRYELAFTEDWGNAGASSSLLEVHRYSALTRFDQALADVAAGHATI